MGVGEVALGVWARSAKKRRVVLAFQNHTSLVLSASSHAQQKLLQEGDAAGALIISLAALALSLPSPGGGAPAALRVGAPVEHGIERLAVNSFRSRAEGQGRAWSSSATALQSGRRRADRRLGGARGGVGAVPTTTAAWAQLHQQASAATGFTACWTCAAVNEKE